MLFSAAVLLSAFASVLAAGSCPRGSDDHRIRKLVARADVVSPNKNIQVHFEFVGTTDGEPTFVKVRGLKGLPTVGGPYAYHLHTNPVPADGNCTKTLGHLDPLNVTDSLVCNPAFPQYCQTGDLSGKHGALNGTTDGKIAAFGYSDAYVRFFPQSHSLLGRSIVIHGANKTRIACGNIVSPLDGTADHKYRPTHKPSEYVKDYPKVAPVLPGPPVIPFNGTQMTDPAVIASLPYPLPVPHLSLAEALNINLTSITHAVKFANSEQTITQPKEEKIGGTGPFKGSWGDDW